MQTSEDITENQDNHIQFMLRLIRPKIKQEKEHKTDTKMANGSFIYGKANSTNKN